MRVDDGKVWMTRDEVREFCRRPEKWERSIAFKLMGMCGLRSFEVTQVKPKHIQRTGEGEHFLLTVPEGKDTTGGSGKTRETWLPESVERDLYRYADERDIGDDESFVDVSSRTVQRWVKQVAGDMEGDGWSSVSSHDLRRSWAQFLLVDERVNVRVVMALGGWSDYSAIKPYLNAPTENVIVDEMSELGL